MPNLPLSTQLIENHFILRFIPTLFAPKDFVFLFPSQRVLLFNAYAMHAMCKAGVDVLDVFPISDAYPGGTGLPGKPYDAAHFKAHVFQSVVNLLQRHFIGHELPND